MNPTAPAASPFDLRWRLFGIGFRVHVSFWLINLLFGYLFLSGFPHAKDRLPLYLSLWVGCAFVSILVHELGHVVMGRLFGATSNIVLYSMGGLAIGDFDRLARWQRILVSMAGPAAGFSLCFLAWTPVASKVFDRFDPVFWANQEMLRDVCLFLWLMNLIWNLFNLIPIIPLDGGMVMLEVVSAIVPRQGARLAYGFSFLFAGVIAVYSLIAYLRPASIPWYPPLDPLFNVIMFVLLASGSFTAMRALETQEQARRHSEYEERDW